MISNRLLPILGGMGNVGVGKLQGFGNTPRVQS